MKQIRTVLMFHTDNALLSSLEKQIKIHCIKASIPNPKHYIVVPGPYGRKSVFRLEGL